MIPLIPPSPLSDAQSILLGIIVGIALLFLIYGDEIIPWLRNIGHRTSRTQSVSTLPPPPSQHQQSSADASDADNDDPTARHHRLIAARLHPFDRVLVRDDDSEMWSINLFERYEPDDEDLCPFFCLDNEYDECIPYEGNEHLLGTNNDFDYSSL